MSCQKDQCSCECDRQELNQSKMAKFNRYWEDRKGIISPIRAVVVNLEKMLTEQRGMVNQFNVICNAIPVPIGYFGAVVNEQGKIVISMTKCVPSDYGYFDSKNGKFVVKKRALNGYGVTLGMLRDNKGEYSYENDNDDYYPDLTYCYAYNVGTVREQYQMFVERCKKYYKGVTEFVNDTGLE